ncbi:5' exonuclease Apollo [Iris pallida]|uniref:5' exonuclease Apollo n=1 Tax=Iris pallida TaxID=29817 RepID=A0AAX6FFK0_IRIPA|nr:5' exonuclease Apollo [Iris pallida]
MPIEMPKGLPFSVDTWTSSSNRKRYHFLTHSHKDHLAGISSNSTFPIYATPITKTIALRIFPQLEESLFVEIGIGETVVIDDPDVPFSVTAFDANHCPGAAMFLFEGEFGNVLHTGDCRLTPDCLQCLPMKYITKRGRENLCHLDYLILDCTFGRCSLKIPSKQSAVQQVINCIWKYPSAPVVYLACDMLGQEEILVELSRTFGSKIYVDKTNNSECFHSLSLIAPEIISQDASSRFQVTEGFPRLNERASQKFAEARANLQAAPLFIRPSAQWYAGTDHLDLTQLKKPGLSEAVMDEFGVWHVCYSMHSSREELEWALQLLQPKWVISSTPPCRAMELDYVKNHCFKTHISSDDPLWKLLRVGPGKSITSSTSAGSNVVKNVSSTSVVAVSATSAESNRLLLKELPANDIDLKELPTNSMELKLDLSPQSSTRTITLFGRARLGLEDTDLLQEKNKSESTYENHSEEVSLQESTVIDQASVVQEGNIAELSVEKSVQKMSIHRDLSLESSAGLNYNELNVEKSVDKGYAIVDLDFENSVEKGNAMVELDVDKSVENDDAEGEGSSIESSRSFVAAKASESSEMLVLEEDTSCYGSSTKLNASLRNLYRSMNVPVPRPLPSLVELMGGSKRVKVGSESYYSSRLK